MDPVDAILSRHNIPGPWTPLPSRGAANRIYATKDVVLRVATDHPEAVEDARTESVAAPVARAVGVRTPELIAFDDSRELTDRPYSLWERVNGETLGVLTSKGALQPHTWQEVGEQLGHLHSAVQLCPDPHGYLDTPQRNNNLESLVEDLLRRQLLDPRLARDILRIVEMLQPVAHSPADRVFLHGDLHDMNIMCAPTDRLLAIIDWGDSGWGDPTLDFADVPLQALGDVLSGYGEAALSKRAALPRARMVWDQLEQLMVERTKCSSVEIPLQGLKRFLEEQR